MEIDVYLSVVSFWGEGMLGLGFVDGCQGWEGCSLQIFSQ